MSVVRTEVENERFRRIAVAVWAYAYEIEATPVVDDATYDREALLIRPKVVTGNATLDAFFRTEFSPHTGMWVHRHPDPAGLARILAFIRPAVQAGTYWALQKTARPPARPAKAIPPPSAQGSLF